MHLTPGLYKISVPGTYWIVWENKVVPLDSIIKKKADGSYNIPVIDSLILFKVSQRKIKPIRLFLYENNSNVIRNLSVNEFAQFLVGRGIDTQLFHVEEE